MNWFTGPFFSHRADIGVRDRETCDVSVELITERTYWWMREIIDGGHERQGRA